MIQTRLGDAPVKCNSGPACAVKACRGGVAAAFIFSVESMTEVRQTMGSPSRLQDAATVLEWPRLLAALGGYA
jgi:hypothetical protein